MLTIIYFKKHEAAVQRGTCGGEEKRGAYRISLGNLRARDHLEDLGVDGRIILKWILKKRDWALVVLMWLR
jgi:hypothetical protein